MSEAKNSGRLPAFQFYPADWRKDPGVQSLDFETRGIWWEIICLMHESDERGVLLLNGQPMPEDALCRLLGLDNQKLQSALSILLTYGVAKRREDGAIFNSRMVKDESLRKSARENGHQGGNPALKGDYKAPGFVYAIRRASDGAIKIGIAQNVTNRFNKLKYTHKGDLLTLEGVMPSQDMGKDEAALHREFTDDCILGEWFKIEGQKLEKLFTLMGITKGDKKGGARASSSFSWKKWQKHRFELKKKLTPTMMESQFSDMLKMGEKRAIAMIHFTVSKGWQGLREECDSGFGSLPTVNKPKYQSCL